MNERIIELAEQADLHATLYFKKEKLEKFAELIVRECISACATDRLGKTVGAEELIKEHFGIEK